MKRPAAISIALLFVIACSCSQRASTTEAESTLLRVRELRHKLARLEAQARAADRLATATEQLSKLVPEDSDRDQQRIAAAVDELEETGDTLGTMVRDLDRLDKELSQAIASRDAEGMADASSQFAKMLEAWQANRKPQAAGSESAAR